MSFWNSREYKAKKKHHCEYCGKTIEIGETYSRETGIYDSIFNDYCLCLRCEKVIPYLKSNGDDELGNFVDDVIESDMLTCPNCQSIRLEDYEFSDDMQEADCVCQRCNRDFTVDLSAEAIIEHFKKEAHNEHGD